MRRGFSLLVLRSKIRAPWRGEDLASFFCIKKMRRYHISWTYADKLHTFKCIIYFHNVRQLVHKKASNKTGFTLVYSFRSYYIFIFEKCQTKISCFFVFMHYNKQEIKKNNFACFESHHFICYTNTNH